ncbi:hypothetical protein FAY30_10970 [Bacillus sp. S3]|uniref:flagellar brake protein n=1 Tax=Bacillus sp. S3 TaxID=486398 RepID=UPI00118B093B|nr:flagellar brake domain-containing protein [Bacillus sp. S3]QCJ42387.1 hypothetical protein FAY30_10970 [Bacillus sp. S3]
MYPKVNQNIIINILSEGIVCRSIVADIGEDEILIGQPMNGKMFGLTRGSRIAISYMTSENKYKFEAFIIGRKKDNIPLYRITKPKRNEIEKIQRRDNFRVPTNLPVKIDKFDVQTINISAGGMLLSCIHEFPFHEGEFLSGTLSIPKTNPISFKAVIKRISLSEELELKQVGVKFTVLDKKDEAKIVQYCFDKQRQARLADRNSNSFK